MSAVVRKASTIEKDVQRRRKFLKEQLDDGGRSRAKRSRSSSKSVKKLESSLRELNNKLNAVLSLASHPLSRGGQTDITSFLAIIL